MKRTTILFAMTLALSASALAANKPVITAVTEGMQVIAIQGSNFVQKNGRLDVYVSGSSTPLQVLVYSDTQIVTALPPGLEPGSYVLSLVGKGDNGDDFSFTLGAQGPKGDTGDAGPAGPAGQTGLKGDTGPAGPQGAKGDTGATGPQGPKGDTGGAGGTGPQGPQGPKGDTGATGATGPQGDPGATGPQGPQGPEGPSGPIHGDVTSDFSAHNLVATGSLTAGSISTTGNSTLAGVTGGSARFDSLNVLGAISAGSLQSGGITTNGSNATANGGLTVAGDLGVAGSASVGGGLALQGALGPNYDSGWFAVNADPTAHTPPRNGNGEIELATGLAGVPTRLMILQCGQLLPTGDCATRTVISGTTGYHDSGSDINPLTVSFGPGSLYLGIAPNWWVWGYWSLGAGWSCPGSPSCFQGFWRVMAWR
ncbi:MAG TPA: IPT/TIG domain-containing protein, partial [Usitatibacter sp.]|nr:IPT/TIG domain-containing protein [Usitatibacter sp.]